MRRDHGIRVSDDGGDGGGRARVVASIAVIATGYPEFFDHLAALGADIERML